MNKKYRLTGKSWQNKTAWKLANENWTLAHEIVDLDRGHNCQIPGCHNDSLQLDHVISRDCKSVFYEIDNLGYLCATHHTVKSFKHGGIIDQKVRELCRKRMGEEKFQRMLEAADRNCGGFRTVLHQEQINIKLKEKRAELLAN